MMRWMRGSHPEGSADPQQQETSPEIEGVMVHKGYNARR